MKQQLRKFVVAICLVILSLSVGITGYMYLEGYNLLDAFYMTVITISTVGFQEVHALSEESRLFTSFYIIFNLGIFAYVISVLTSYLFEGKLKSVFKNYMDDRQINKLRDHVIVCGFGRNGSEACEELIKEGREVVVIDNDPDVRELQKPIKNLYHITADASHDSNLRITGIESARDIIITTSSDAVNVFITLTARELNPNIHIISRASEIRSESKLYRAGADHVILPDKLGGLFMAQMITKPVVIEFLDLLTGRGRDSEKYVLESITYKELRDEFKDKTLRELDIHHHTGATVIAVKDNIKGMIPNPPRDTFIGVDNTIVLLCSENSRDKILENLSR